MQNTKKVDLVAQFRKENVDFSKIEKARASRTVVTTGLEAYTGTWGTAQKKHLLNRVLTGYGSKHLLDLNNLSLQKSLDLIFTPEKQPSVPVNDYDHEITKEETEKQLHFYVEPGKEYAFAPEQLQFEAIGSIDVGKFIQTSPSKSDSITLWYPTSTLDSLNFIAKAISGDSLRSDTLHFSTKKTGSSAGRGKNKKLSADTLLQVSLNVSQGKLIEGDSLKIRFSAPLPQNNPSVIALMNETDTLQLAAVYKSPNQMLHVFALPKSNRAFTLSIAKGSFSDIFGRVCDSLKQSISYASEDDLGNLEFIFRNDSIQGFTGILELLDKNAALIQSRKITNTETLVFKALIPGEYTIRLTEELDANGTWTSGSLQQKRQPERMFYYPEKFSVRAGWDLELEWEPLKELGRKRRK
jgi:hypothetical protein